MADIEVIPTRADYWRSLCEELIQLDKEQPTEYSDWKKRWNAAVSRTRAALAQPEPAGLPPRVGHILRLAEIIREVDGNHDKGAAALAEAILSHPGSRWQPSTPTSQEV